MKKHVFLLTLGMLWISINIFLLPFVVWTAGIVRPWYINHGLLPYHDFVWIRTPFDLWLLSFWYKVFGTTPFSYQLFTWTILIITAFMFYGIAHKLLSKYAQTSYIIFLGLLFPLFINAEEGELLIGLLALIGFYFLCSFVTHHRTMSLFLVGIISGMLIITKQNTVFYSLAGLAVITVNEIRKKTPVKMAIRRGCIFLTGIFIPIFLTLLYFAYQRILNEMIYHTVFIVLGAYRNAHISKGDGLWMAGAYLCAIAAFVILWKQIKVSVEIKTAIVLYSIALLASLLPSFLSYRAYPAFPIIALTVAIILGTIRLQFPALHRIHIIIAILLLLTAVGVLTRYVREYVAFIKENRIHTNQYITDYHEDELEAANWISTHTASQERIMNYGSEMIYLLSNRLPANKHIDPFPYILQPYERTSLDFYRAPPTIILFDETLPDVHLGLSSWPIVQFLQKQYAPVQKFGESLTIYRYVKN